MTNNFLCWLIGHTYPKEDNKGFCIRCGLHWSTLEPESPSMKYKLATCLYLVAMKIRQIGETIICDKLTWRPAQMFVFQILKFIVNGTLYFVLYLFHV